MTGRSEIEREILDFVKREILPRAGGLTAESDLVAEGFDSLSLVNLLLFIEKKFGVWIPEKAIGQSAIASVRNLAETVCRHLDDSETLHERH